MFEKFITTPECMNVLAWLLGHPNDKYSADIIAIECNMSDMSTFMAVLTTLEGVNLIEFDDFSEKKLFLGLKKDSSNTDLLLHFKDEFNDCAFRSEQVSPSLAYLHSSEIKKAVDAQIFEKYKAEEIVDMCKNYKDLKLENDFEKEIFTLCSKLEETGDYEEFISKLEDDIK